MPNEILSSVRGRITKLALVYTGDTNQKAYFEYFASNLSFKGNDTSRFKVIIFMGMESFENDLLSSGYFEVELNKSTFKPVMDASLIKQLGFIGSDDVRTFNAGPITMNGKKWLRIATGKQFKMKVENNKIIVVYET